MPFERTIPPSPTSKNCRQFCGFVTKRMVVGMELDRIELVGVSSVMSVKCTPAFVESSTPRPFERPVPPGPKLFSLYSLSPER